ncbi:hypothetical protein [Schlesneria paludicola]|uniref:hypothetical protein n=1 Tax=Schlesneria paludicola TaxID=360056 RepID=UPI00029A4D90|nr:hypothetical protein [Schlesneria paludicola]
MVRGIVWGCLLGIFCFAAQGIAVDAPVAVRFPVGHQDAGLPTSDLPLAAYHESPEHPLNRLHQLLFMADLVPEEINGALPREVEAKTDATKPWYFRKRAGTAADRKLFGGDVRVSPVLTWPTDRTASLLAVANELLAMPWAPSESGLSPLNRLMLQWDLLSVWWRLEQQADTPPEVLHALAKLIQKTAQPASVLRALPTGWNEGHAQFATANESTSAATPYFSAADILAGKDGWVELSRRSTKLFVSPQSMRSSRVFLRLPPGTDLPAWMETQSVASKHPEKRPPQRIETAMVLSLIGMTAELEPVATPFIDEIRFRTVFGADEAVDVSQTTTRDGSNLWLYLVDRQQTFSTGTPSYRFIADENQAIFPEYGSAKHATYAAQCTLCHRLTNSGNQTLAGVRTLSTIAKAQVSDQPQHRHRLAESQMQVVTERLKLRLEQGSASLPAATFDFRSLPAE